MTEARRRAERTKRLGQAASYAVIGLLCVVSLLPVAWMVTTSLKPPGEIFTAPPRWLPAHPTLENYVEVLRRADIRRSAWNSLVIATLTTAVAVVVAVPTGYGFARYRFKGSNWMLLAILFAQMMPAAIVLIPLFVVFQSMGLLNTYPGLVLSYLILTLPLSVWMMRGYFQSVPRELEEAALIDGCSRVRAMWRVVVPITAPAVAATAIYAFVVAWNEFLFALVLTTSTATRTLPIGIANFMGEFKVDWGPLMAVATLASVPIVALFMSLHRYFVQGLAQGAVKE